MFSVNVCLYIRYIVRLLCYIIILNLNCCIKWNSESSTEFCVSNGVKQGVVIFHFYLVVMDIDALFERLKCNGIGCNVSPAYTCAFGCADDVALIVSSLHSFEMSGRHQITSILLNIN